MKDIQCTLAGPSSMRYFTQVALTLLLGGCSSSGPEDSSRKIIHPLPGNTVILEFEGSKVTAADVDSEVAPDLERMRDEAVRSYRNHAEARVKALALDKSAKSQGFSSANEMIQALKKKTAAQITDTEVAKYLQQNHLNASSSIEIRKFLETQAWIAQKSTLEASILNSAHLAWKIAPARYTLSSGLPGMMFGNRGAEVQIQEFCDFTNPLCSSWNMGLRGLAQKHPNQILWVFHPLASHEHAGSEALALGAICAGRVNRFLEYSSALSQDPGAAVDGHLERLIQPAGLDETSFQKCVKDASPALAKEQKEARESGVIEAPAVFVNGERAGSLDEVASRVGLELGSAH